MNKSGKGENKRVVIAIIITVVVILVLVAGYFLYKNYENKRLNQAYSLGYNQSMQYVAQWQTQNLQMLTWQDNSIQVLSLQDICSGNV